jgi:hypothetical protein
MMDEASPLQNSVEWVDRRPPAGELAMPIQGKIVLRR